MYKSCSHRFQLLHVAVIIWQHSSLFVKTPRHLRVVKFTSSLTKEFISLTYNSYALSQSGNSRLMIISSLGKWYAYLYMCHAFVCRFRLILSLELWACKLLASAKVSALCRCRFDRYILSFTVTFDNLVMEYYNNLTDV